MKKIIFSIIIEELMTDCSDFTDISYYQPTRRVQNFDNNSMISCGLFGKNYCK
jgi:hypothetical protein